MIALARKEGLIYMRGSPRGTQELAFDQGANKPAEKQCNYNLQICCVSNKLTLNTAGPHTSKSVFQMGMTKKCGNVSCLNKL